MSTIKQPTAVFGQVQETWDGGELCFDVVSDSDSIADLFEHKHLYVIEEEQRGNNPVSGKEVVSEDKLNRWVQQELAGEFHVGQLTAAVRTEEGGYFEHDPAQQTLAIYGDLVLPDSRQRVYTLVRAVQGRKNGNGYKGRRVSLRIYPSTSPESRKALFYDYNQEGDHADESRSKWLAPKGFSQTLAKRVVEKNKHLTHRNVNTVQNRVTSKDHRLAGHNTFAQAIDAAWGKILVTQDDVDEAAEFLNKFWTKLVKVLPDLGILTLPQRKAVREQSLVGNPLAIYGYMAVAKAIFEKAKAEDDEPDYSVLDALGADTAWFDVGAQHWKDLGIVVPRRDVKTGNVKGWRIANSFQTRKAMAEAMLERLEEHGFEPAAKAA